MGVVQNMHSAAGMEAAGTLQQLVAEQRETNRLLRKLAGEPQPEFEASDQSRRARKWRLARGPR